MNSELGTLERISNPIRMTIEELLSNKSVKAKEKTETLSKWLLSKKITTDELLSVAHSAKDPSKATCIEALEFATKQKPGLADDHCFQFVTEALKSKAPRIKWESAKVIGNTAHLFSKNLDDVIANLVVNSRHDGTVVRWSSAFALGEILKLETKHNKKLLSEVQVICDWEEKNGIRKIYLEAIKRTTRSNV